MIKSMKETSEVNFTLIDKENAIKIFLTNNRYVHYVPFHQDEIYCKLASFTM